MAESVPIETQPVPTVHRAAKIEDLYHRWRERRGRRRGLVTTIIPYAGYGSTRWVRVLCRVVLARAEGAAKQRAEKVRGWRSFFSIPVNDAAVTVTIAGADHLVTPDRGGVVDVRVEAELESGWQQITLRADGTESITTPVFIVDPKQRFGIVSDVDDTVMVTALPRPFLAAWNTFVLDEHARTPVAGMSVLYERLSREHPGAPVIYLSTGAWNVAPTLTRFLERNLYPRGVMLLTDWGPTHDRWFRSGQEHKRNNLERLALEFPDMHWLLVGDDGQHDEAIYAAFAAAHPDNVAAVAIRRLSPGEAVLAGGRNTVEAHAPVPWFAAPDGAGLARVLSGAGLLSKQARR
jgi:phosphatidate phosphatase APP1